MNRVLVLGAPGSGKSTLARTLAGALNLPYVSLDDQYWGPQWARPDPKYWEQHLTQILENPSWLIDGNYARELSRRAEYAEMAILLDVAPLLCCWRVLNRVSRIRHGEHHLAPREIAKELDEGKTARASADLLPLLWMTARFRHETLPVMRRVLASQCVPLIVTDGREPPGSLAARLLT